LYDPFETDLSLQFLLKLVDNFGCEKFGILGGWATYFITNNVYREATGREYLKSRDIDVFISANPKFVEKFKNSIRKTGFSPGGYPFRYTLLVDRRSKKIITEKNSRSLPLFDLFYVDLDVYSSKKTVLSNWVDKVIEEIFKGKKRIVFVEGRRILIPSEELLLQLKINSYTGRGKQYKRLKDACDIYSLLFYSDLKKKWDAIRNKNTLDAIKKIATSEDVAYIAEYMFGDRYVEGLIRRNFEKFIK